MVASILFKRSAWRAAILVAFAAVFLWSAISPEDRSDWWTENVLVFAIVIAGVIASRRIGFSNLSYLLVAIFLCLHEIGAHYTYELVPFGFWLKKTFDFARNDYDRIVHFAFGFCWALVIRELIVKFVKKQGLLTYLMPVSIVLSLSAVYEIEEAYVATRYPGMEEAYVGLQGDIFDSQRDMTCALAGAVLMMIAIAVFNRSIRRARPEAVSVPESESSPSSPPRSLLTR